MREACEYAHREQSEQILLHPVVVACVRLPQFLLLCRSGRWLCFLQFLQLLRGVPSQGLDQLLDVKAMLFEPLLLVRVLVKQVLQRFRMLQLFCASIRVSRERRWYTYLATLLVSPVIVVSPVFSLRLLLPLFCHRPWDTEF